MTKNDSLIVVSYHTNSTENYNKNISEFENSVKTIRISEPGDIKNLPSIKITRSAQNSYCVIYWINQMLNS